MAATVTDTIAFIELVRGLGGGRWRELHQFFESDNPISIARAPGRLDVMGGIADCSGSLVLQWPTREATYVAAQLTTSEDWQIVSLPTTKNEPLRRVTLSKQSRASFGDYGTARDWFQQDASTTWAAYLAGLYGAKLTGGGSGGTVAILGRNTASDAVEAIAKRYADETGHEGYVFRGSSDGAWKGQVRSICL